MGRACAGEWCDPYSVSTSSRLETGTECIGSCALIFRYCDTVSGDWLIDYHPDVDNVVIASGDSGHGFKFTPIIGREILKVIERNPSPEYAVRWSFNGDLVAGADVRTGERQELRVEDLVTKEDLQGQMVAKL